MLVVWTMNYKNSIVFAHEIIIVVKIRFDVFVNIEFSSLLFVITFYFVNVLVILGHCLPLFRVFLLLLNEFSITCSRLLVLLIAWSLISKVLFKLTSTIKTFSCPWYIYFIQKQK